MAAPYPNVYKPDNSGVDDLWHAAINGRGRFVNAPSADELKLGMGQILQDILNQAGSRSAAGFGSNVLATNNAVYVVAFRAGLGRRRDQELTSIRRAAWCRPISRTDGTRPSSCRPSCTVINPGDTPWFTNRKIVTINDRRQGRAVPMG